MATRVFTGIPCPVLSESLNYKALVSLAATSVGLKNTFERWVLDSSRN
ncbi:MAG: hypothetical protein J6U18_05675 [Acetobacter sp.]|nr:hypothetical protein [Acetobacter sp.]